VTIATPPAPYLHFPGTARDALTFYARVFGGSAQLHTCEDFNRTDGPAEAIAHGYLKDSPVLLFAADAAGDQLPLRCEGLTLSLLGTADASTLKDWFARLCEGGRVVDDLQMRPLAVVMTLQKSEMRFNELQRAIPRVNAVTLTSRLKKLEEAGIVSRAVESRGRQSTVYALTPTGERLLPIVDAVRAVALDLERSGDAPL